MVQIAPGYTHINFFHSWAFSVLKVCYGEIIKIILCFNSFSTDFLQLDEARNNPNENIVVTF